MLVSVLALTLAQAVLMTLVLIPLPLLVVLARRGGSWLMSQTSRL